MRRVGVAGRVASSGWRRRRLLILCYHGVSRYDEHVWNPALYVSARRFARRMELIREHRCKVLPLGEAVERLERNDLPDRAVVLTFDDGYFDFATSAHPVLRAHGYPATVYLTTFRCEHNFPIVRLLLSYLLWYRRDTPLDGAGLPGLTPGVYRLDAASARDRIVKTLLSEAPSATPNRMSKDAVARMVAERLSVNYEALAAMRMLTLLAPREVTQLAGQGVDFQLHTHFHRSPDDAAVLRQEIRTNRERLEAMTGRRATHFCWPSGVYWRSQLPTLEAEGVTTATTCEPRLARAQDERLLLPRFVDTSHVSEDVFVSWLEGTAALVTGRAPSIAATQRSAG